MDMHRTVSRKICIRHETNLRSSFQRPYEPVLDSIYLFKLQRLLNYYKSESIFCCALTAKRFTFSQIVFPYSLYIHYFHIIPWCIYSNTRYLSLFLELQHYFLHHSTLFSPLPLNNSLFHCSISMYIFYLNYCVTMFHHGLPNELSYLKHLNQLSGISTNICKPKWTLHVCLHNPRCYKITKLKVNKHVFPQQLVSLMCQSPPTPSKYYKFFL